MVNIRQYWDSRFGSPGLAFARHAPGPVSYCASPGRSSECGGIGAVGRRVTADTLRQSEIAFGDEVCGI